MPSPSPEYYGRPVPFGYSSRQTNFVDWYPFVPPYQPGEGWLAHRPGAFGEHLVYESADFEVNIQVLDPDPDLLIAASAPAIKDGEGWRYQLDNARNFAWSASDQYVLSTTTVDSILVMSYFFPFDSRAGESALQTTAESLALYNDLFGPYPRQTLTVVEADFLDGMEYDGLYFLSRGFYSLFSGDPGDYLTAIAAHETAHQWWYGAVGNDQALEPWLDEALSTYCERLYYENKHPDGLDWWWSFRIDYYDPRGFIDGSIYNPQGYRAYRDAVYLNGAMFFEDLRYFIGDGPFFDFLETYARIYTHKIAAGDAFFELLADYTQEDLSPLLDEYFQSR
jgi:aminopeptidase N